MATEQEITKEVARLCKRLDLGWLEVTNVFYPRLADAAGDDDQDTVCIAKCDNWAYRRLTLRWNKATLAEQTATDITDYAIHELVHGLTACFVEPVTPYIKSPNQLGALNEMATENVARAISAALQGGKA